MLIPCLFQKQKPLLSAVCLPYSHQLFSAAKTIGSFLNQVKIHVNKKRGLKNAIIYLMPPCYGKIPNKDFEKNFNKIKKLTKAVYRLRYGVNENTYNCFVGLGSIEAYLDIAHPTKSIEDSVPGLFIAQMAGAKITDLKGNKIDFGKPDQLYITSNDKIHDQLVQILS